MLSIKTKKKEEEEKKERVVRRVYGDRRTRSEKVIERSGRRIDSTRSGGSNRRILKGDGEGTHVVEMVEGVEGERTKSGGHRRTFPHVYFI